MRTEIAPAFQQFAAEELADAVTLGPAAYGAREILKSRAWREGSMPDDDRLLAKMVGMSAREFQKHSVAIRASLAKQGDRLVFPGLEAQRARQKERREKASASANARWDKDKEPDDKDMRTHSERIANAERTECPVVAKAVVVASEERTKRPRSLNRSEKAQPPHPYSLALIPIVNASFEHVSGYTPIRVDNHGSRQTAERLEELKVDLAWAKEELAQRARQFNIGKHGKGELPGSLRYFERGLVTAWKEYKRQPQPLAESSLLRALA